MQRLVTSWIINIQRSSQLFVSRVITNTSVFFPVGGVHEYFAPSKVVSFKINANIQHCNC